MNIFSYTVSFVKECFISIILQLCLKIPATTHGVSPSLIKVKFIFNHTLAKV
jgi:hypothetical protein